MKISCYVTSYHVNSYHVTTLRSKLALLAVKIGPTASITGSYPKNSAKCRRTPSYLWLTMSDKIIIFVHELKYCEKFHAIDSFYAAENVYNLAPEFCGVLQ